jgi:ankyrin repeat protein
MLNIRYTSHLVRGHEQEICIELIWAAERGDLERVEILIRDYPDLVFSAYGNNGTPLHAAAGHGRRKVAEFLLANKADVNTKDINRETALHCAAKYRCVGVAKLLLTNKADVNAMDNAGRTPLQLAELKATWASSEVAKLLRRRQGSLWARIVG